MRWKDRGRSEEKEEKASRKKERERRKNFKKIEWQGKTQIKGKNGKFCEKMRRREKEKDGGRKKGKENTKLNVGND